MFLLFVCFLLGLFCSAAPFPEPSQEYDGQELLRNDVYRLFWAIRNDVITFEAQVRTRGWIGLGFSTNGKMIGSDIMTAWVTDGGILHLQDRRAFETSLPPIDESQDYQALWGVEVNGYTVVKFRRRLRTCDVNDSDILFGTIRLVFAWHSTDPKDERSLLKHEQRGSRSVNLIIDDKEQAKLPDDAIELRFSVPNYLVPMDTMTYYCSFHSMPDFKRKHHIVKMEVQVQPGNEDIVHHMTVYWCNNDVDPDIVAGRGIVCDDYKAYPIFREVRRNCTKMFYVWALGGKEFTFPENVGLAIGEPDSPRAFYVEIHYDNSKHEPERYDATTFIATATPSLRDEDSNLVWITRSSLILPPHLEALRVYGICKLDICLRWWTLQHNVTIFAVMLHTHGAGKSVRLRHFRNDQELPVIAEEVNYDSNFQQIYHLSQGPVHVNMETDRLVVECTYDTSLRDSTTYFGGATLDEMCMVFVFIYPANTFIRCENGVDQLAQLQPIGVKNYAGDIVTSPESLAGRSWRQLLDEANWRDENLVKSFQNVMFNATRMGLCDDRDFSRNNQENFEMNIEPYRTPANNCTPVTLGEIKESPPSYIKADCKPVPVTNAVNVLEWSSGTLCVALAYVLLLLFYSQ